MRQVTMQIRQALAAVHVAGVLGVTSLGFAALRPESATMSPVTRLTADAERRSLGRGLGTTTDSVLALLGDPSHDVQRRALLYVATIRAAEPNVVARMVALLGSTNREVRGAAFHALMRLHAPIETFALDGTRDSSAAVRAQSAMLLVRPPRSGRSERRLREMLLDTDPGVRQTVADLLSDVSGIPLLPHASR